MPKIYKKKKTSQYFKKETIKLFYRIYQANSTYCNQLLKTLVSIKKHQQCICTITNKRLYCINCININPLGN